MEFVIYWIKSAMDSKGEAAVKYGDKDNARTKNIGLK